MSTTEDNGNIEGHATSTETSGGVGQQMSQRFRPLTAMRIFRGRLGGTAQHVAMVLAADTRAERGEVAVTLAALARTVDYSTETVRKAIAEIVEAGFLTKKRRGSVANVYRWTTAAYQDLPVGQKRDNW